MFAHIFKGPSERPLHATTTVAIRSKPIAPVIGVSQVVQLVKELTEEVQKDIQSINPDLVITFDLAGLYGHPDHIATSEVVTEVMKENFPTKKLWYVSYPKKILDMTSLPEWMAKDPNFKDKRVYPTMKVWTGLEGVVRKIKAVYAYNSQRQSYLDSFPIKIIPLWFYVSLTPYEYFYEAQK